MFCSRRGNRFTNSITCPVRSITGTMGKVRDLGFLSLQFVNPDSELRTPGTSASS
jgi:hypothetical protein